MLQKQVELHKKHNQKEIVVGWFTTMADLSQITLSFHSFFVHTIMKKEFMTRSIIFMKIDPSLKSERIPIQVF